MMKLYKAHYYSGKLIVFIIHSGKFQNICIDVLINSLLLTFLA